MNSRCRHESCGSSTGIRSRSWRGRGRDRRSRRPCAWPASTRRSCGGKCEGEKERARAAAAFVAARLTAGAPVWLIAPRPDTSPGARTLARMVMADGRDLAAMLIAAGLGRPYEGGKRPGWCAESEP